MKFRSGDVDIDFGSRDLILNHIQYTRAAMLQVSPIRPHSSGVYPSKIPYDPKYDMASIDYAEAEARGYFKLDLLNVQVYDQVRNEEHLKSLMVEPNWEMLKDRAVVKGLVHVNNHYNSIRKMPEPINSIPRLAMFLAIIRPGKRHLIGCKWDEVAKTIWDKDANGEYVFRKSHSIAYAHLVVVHLNLMKETG